MTIKAKTAFEWTWRTAMLAALLWVGSEVRQLHQDLLQLPPETQAAQDEPMPDDPLQASIDDLQDDVQLLSQKVDAMLIAMAQLKR